MMDSYNELKIDLLSSCPSTVKVEFELLEGGDRWQSSSSSKGHHETLVRRLHESSSSSSTRLGVTVVSVDLKTGRQTRIADEKIDGQFCGWVAGVYLTVRWQFNPTIDYRPFDDDLRRPKNELRVSLIRGRFERLKFQILDQEYTAGVMEEFGLAVSKPGAPLRFEGCEVDISHLWDGKARREWHAGVELWLAWGYNPDLDLIERADLYEAARTGQVASFKKMLLLRQEESGGVVNERCSNRGRSLLHEAALHGQNDIIKILVEDFDASVHKTTLLGRETPLHLAVKGSHRRAAFLLLEYGAPRAAPNAYGAHPLHYATDASVARLLLRYGASATALNSDRKTPFDAAKSNGADDSCLRELERAAAEQKREMYHASIEAERAKQHLIHTTIQQRAQLKATALEARRADAFMADYLEWRSGKVTGNMLVERRLKAEDQKQRRLRLEAHFQAVGGRPSSSSSPGDNSSRFEVNPRERDVSTSLAALARATFTSTANKTPALPNTLTDALKMRQRDHAINDLRVGAEEGS